jgi:hypothetical protein
LGSGTRALLTTNKKRLARIKQQIIITSASEYQHQDLFISVLEFLADFQENRHPTEWLAIQVSEVSGRIQKEVLRERVADQIGKVSERKIREKIQIREV